MKITIIAPGVNINATLRDEAFTEVVKLMEQFRDLQAVSDNNQMQKPAQPVADAPLSEIPTEESIKAQLKNYGSTELLNKIRWESYPEKILLLAAWAETHGRSTPWRSSDMDEIFKQAKEKPPANFPRDIKQAIRLSWIHATTPRTYSITRTGWNKIAEALSQGSGS